MNSDKKYEIIAEKSLDLLHGWVKKYKICDKEPEKSYSPNNISQQPKDQPNKIIESADIFQIEQIPQFNLLTKNQVNG